jgi:isoleucyl-tRNA synthetase
VHRRRCSATPTSGSELTERIGFWVDLDDAYVTFHKSYVESVWWALSELFKKGLLYQGHKVVWWWPQGGTALSAARSAWATRPWTIPSVIVRFPVADSPAYEPARLDDHALDAAVEHRHRRAARLDYAVAAFGTARPSSSPRRCGDGPRRGLRRHRAQHHEGRRAGRHGATSRCSASPTPEGGDAVSGHRRDFVTADSGTGLVHTAPAFGEDDFKVAKLNGIGIIQLVEPDGNFDPRRPDWLAGKFCKDADNDIIRDLKGRGLLFNARRSTATTTRSAGARTTTRSSSTRGRRGSSARRR